MQIGAVPEKLVKGLFKIIGNFIKISYHKIKMYRYYKNSREGK